MSYLDKEIEMLCRKLEEIQEQEDEKDTEEMYLMIHTIQCMKFLNKALKSNNSKLLSTLLALNESAEIHWSKKEDTIIHASVYHLIPRQQLMELDIKVMFDSSACIMKAKFL